jgi:hypothetical protein
MREQDIRYTPSIRTVPTPKTQTMGTIPHRCAALMLQQHFVPFLQSLSTRLYHYTMPVDLPHTWSAFIGHCPIQHRHSSAIETQLRHHLYGDPADIHCSTALQRFLKRHTLHGHVRIAYILHDWLPTNCHQHRYKPLQPACCSFGQEKETKSHMYQLASHPHYY